MEWDINLKTTREYVLATPATKERYEKLSGRVERLLTNEEKLVNRKLTNLIGETMERFSDYVVREHDYEEDKYVELFVEGTNSIFVMDYDDERAGVIIVYMKSARRNMEHEITYGVFDDKPRKWIGKHDYSDVSIVKQIENFDLEGPLPITKDNILALTDLLSRAEPHPNPQNPIT